jgi:hypothetical protein
MATMNKNCQSCGMPLKKSPSGGGTKRMGLSAGCIVPIAMKKDNSNNRIGPRPKCRVL